MAVDTKQYIQELLKAAGVADDKQQAVLATFEDERVSKAFADEHIRPRMRADEFSRKMDELKGEKDKWTKWYTDSLAEYQKNQQIVSDYESRVKAYETQYGPIDGNVNGQRLAVASPANPDMFTRKDFETEMQKREAANVELLKIGLKLSARHLHEFKEPLDVDGLAKQAIERNVSLQQAYDDMMQPKREEIAKTRHDEEIRLAREEGARDFASKHKIPVDAKPRETAPLFNRLAMDESKLPPAGQPRDAALRSSFVDAWNSAAEGGTTS
jgi:hypothetical protein